ncbi:MAG: hypothetical protein ACRDYX_02670 [Egibacteraceae bacterium]
MVEHIAKGLRQCEKNSTRAWMEHQEQTLVAQMNLFACRLYLTPARAAATLGKPNDPSVPWPHVCIDFRFEEHCRRYWLYATLSIWTHKPSSTDLAPNSSDLPPDDPAEGPWKLKKLHEHYDGKLGEKFEKRVQDHFDLAEMEILDREYRPPQFWLVENPGLPVTLKTADDLDTEDLNARGGVLLRTPDIRSIGVAVSMMERQMLTLRRFVLSDREGLPCYVVIPLAQEAIAEEDVWRLTQILTDLEASTAAQLFDVATALEVQISHLEVYEAVAAQADVFWDQLALYLPHWRRLIRVHKVIELVHQTLLQGIADLDQVAILANKALQDAEQSATDLKDRFDEKLTERLLPEAQSVGLSLIQTGYLDDATRKAKLVVKQAEQVQHSYKALLEGIALAFDERRVRGTDVLEHVGFALALLVVVFSFLPEALNAIFAVSIDPQSSNPNVPVNRNRLNNLTVVGIAGLVLAGLWVLLRRWQLGILGSRRFRKRHKQLREFLTDCKTDRLTRLREEGWERVQKTLDHRSRDEERAWDRFIDEWDKRDYMLARQCAELFDELAHDEIYDKYYTPLWSLTPALKNLARRVERWALKSLLVSERPLEFSQFPLPRLTFLYRFYPTMGSVLLSSSIENAEADVVSDADLRFTVINQCSGRPEEIGLIKRWARHQIEQSRFKWGPATHFVKALKDVGLKAGMTRRDFKAMLNKMGAQLPAPPRSAGR